MPYSNKDMDKEFAEFEHLQHDSTFKDEEWDPYIERMFRIEDGYFWKWAEPGERLYHKFDDGSLCINAGHLKAGLRLPPHKFITGLFRYHFHCPTAQFTPNAMRCIDWLIASCNDSLLLGLILPYFI